MNLPNDDRSAPAPECEMICGYCGASCKGEPGYVHYYDHRTGCPRLPVSGSVPAPDAAPSGATERFEVQAAAFYDATGYMAPGKDVPAGMGATSDYEMRRQIAWDAWCAGKEYALRAASEAMTWDERRRAQADMLLGSLAALDVGYCPDCPAFFLLDKEGESCDHQVAPLTDQQRDDLHDAIRERLLAAPCSHGPLPSEPSEAAIKAAFPHVFGRGPEPDPERDGPELAALEAGLIAAYAAERSPEGPAPEGGKTS